MVPVPLGATSPKVQVISSSTFVYEPVALTNVVSAGMVSRISTSVAQPVPIFAYSIVYVTVSSGSA